MCEKALFCAEDSGGEKMSGKWNLSLGIKCKGNKHPCNMAGLGDSHVAIAYFG